MKILVIGAGTMGIGIAPCLATANLQTYLYDINQDAGRKSLQNLHKIMDRQVEKGRMTVEDQTRLFDSLIPIQSIEECGTVDLVIEAIIEKMEAKKQLFQMLSNQPLGSPIFATNTSSLSITELAASVPCSNRVMVCTFSTLLPHEISGSC
jgi:3-hydroxybutyryl-CoA dehydrogenase